MFACNQVRYVINSYRKEKQCLSVLKYKNTVQNHNTKNIGANQNLKGTYRIENTRLEFR